jgi:hypothetical protein
MPVWPTDLFSKDGRSTLMSHTYNVLKIPPGDLVPRIIGAGGKRIDPIRISTNTNIMFRKMLDKDNNMEEVALITGSQEAVMRATQLIREVITSITSREATAQASAQALFGEAPSGVSPVPKKPKY